MYPAMPPMVYPTPAPPPHGTPSISRRSSIADMSSVAQETPVGPAAPAPIIFSPIINLPPGPDPPQAMDEDSPPPMTRAEASTQTPRMARAEASTQTPRMARAEASTQTPRMARAQTSTQTDPPPRPMPEPAFAVPRTENPGLRMVAQTREIEPNVPPMARLEVHNDVRARLRPLPGRDIPVGLPLQQQGNVQVLTGARQGTVEGQGGVQLSGGGGRRQAAAPLQRQGDVQLTVRGSGHLYNPQTAVITELPDSPRGQIVLRNTDQRLEPIVGVVPSVGARRPAEHEGESRVVRRRV
jgi:hypothetical protein